MLSALEYAPEPVADMTIPVEFRISGWVYVLSNECMPGIYKIGMTTTDPEMRAKEISQATGVPTPFTVVRAYFSENPREDELIIHEELADYRFNPNREFFKCPLAVIEECVAHNALFGREESVSKIADDFSIISFERNKKLDLDDLFDALGLTVFGDRIAIAERLIEMAAQKIRTLNTRGLSLVFSDGVAIPVEQDAYRRHEWRVMQQAKQEAETGIFGPAQPEPIPDFLHAQF